MLKPHGLRGEVKVQLHFVGSEALHAAERVLLCRDGDADRFGEVESVRGSPHGLLLKLAGIDDRDSAETLRGVRLCVPRETLPALEPGEYYLIDLIGARVTGPDGDVGHVIDVKTHPSIDCLVVRLVDGRVAEQPLSEPWIAEVDAAAGRVELASVDGLIL